MRLDRHLVELRVMSQHGGEGGSGHVSTAPQPEVLQLATETAYELHLLVPDEPSIVQREALKRGGAAPYEGLEESRGDFGRESDAPHAALSRHQPSQLSHRDTSPGHGELGPGRTGLEHGEEGGAMRVAGDGCVEGDGCLEREPLREYMLQKRRRKAVKRKKGVHMEQAMRNTVTE